MGTVRQRLINSGTVCTGDTGGTGDTRDTGGTGDTHKVAFHGDSKAKVNKQWYSVYMWCR